MEIEEVEATLEKIWDLHDKLSDAIHSISRTHFINSTKSIKNPGFSKNKSQFDDHFDGNNVNNSNGFVFVKDFDKDSSAIFEAKSLNSIRSALENLEDQLEFFHNVQVQQRAERDAALARLEQCRLILALRLAEHNGKKYKVIDEAINFVGDASCFIGPTEHTTQQSRVSSNLLVRILLSGFNTAKRTLQPNKMVGVVGNAAVFALSMLALLQLHQVTSKDHRLLDIGWKQGEQGGTGKMISGRVDESPFSGRHLDVRLARG